MNWRIEVENTGDVFSCTEDVTVLKAMAVAGARGIPLGCRGGGCGVCKVQVVRGRYHACKMSRACISSGDEQHGTVLACRIMPLTDLSLRVVGTMQRCIDKARERARAQFQEQDTPSLITLQFPLQHADATTSAQN